MTGSFLYFRTGFNKFIANNLTVKREFYAEQNLQKNRLHNYNRVPVF